MSLDCQQNQTAKAVRFHRVTDQNCQWQKSTDFVTPGGHHQETATIGQGLETDDVNKQNANNDRLKDLRPERRVRRNKKTQGFLGNIGQT
jgi:hypothetical protein